MSQPRMRMCPPTYYGIEYEINPWMSRSQGSDRSRAHRQWEMLRDTLLGLGVAIELMTPQSGLPDLVFTANAGLIYRQRFFSSLFRHEVRARETPHFDAWFAEHGFVVEHLPAEFHFEGAGDALFCGSTLFAGYRIRSDVRGHQCESRCFLSPAEAWNDRLHVGSIEERNASLRQQELLDAFRVAERLRGLCGWSVIDVPAIHESLDLRHRKTEQVSLHWLRLRE